MCALAALMPTPVDQELKYMPYGWTVFSALYELIGISPIPDMPTVSWSAQTTRAG